MVNLKIIVITLKKKCDYPAGMHHSLTKSHGH